MSLEAQIAALAQAIGTDIKTLNTAIASIGETADTLTTPRAIQGVLFNGSADINVISIGAVAPSNPVLNQLWLQIP